MVLVFSVKVDVRDNEGSRALKNIKESNRLDDSDDAPYAQRDIWTDPASDIRTNAHLALLATGRSSKRPNNSEIVGAQNGAYLKYRRRKIDELEPDRLEQVASE